MSRRQKPPTSKQRAMVVKVITEVGLDKEAMISAGIPHSSFYTFLAKGRGDRDAGVDSLYRVFLDAYEKAHAARTSKLVKRIQLAGTDKRHWTATAWLLERTDPKRFAPRVRVHVTEELNDAIARLREAFKADPEGLERALTAIAGGHGGDGAESDSSEAGSEDDGGSEALPPAPTEPEAS